MDLTYFPFDKQKCSLIIGSWAYTPEQVDIFAASRVIYTDEILASSEWELLDTNVKKFSTVQTTAEKKHGYWPKYKHPNLKFPRLTFDLYLKRKSHYYYVNIVIPWLFFLALALMVFWLRPESGEKVTLGVTALLAFSVFQIVVDDVTPHTSSSSPVLSE